MKNHSITILIAHNDINFRKKIQSFIYNSKNVKIMDFAENGKEAIEKIKDLKPDMVFVNFDLQDMNGVKIVKSLKSALQDDVPIFNFIVNDSIVSDNLKPQFKEIIKLIGNKLNSVIEPNDPKERYIQIIDDYIEYEESKHF